MRWIYISGIIMCMLILALLLQRGKSIQFSASDSYSLDLPDGFPEIPQPENNHITLERVDFGKQLFYDKRLSKDSTIACSNCHLPSAAFSDHQIKSIGIHQLKGKRNVPTLANVAYHPYFFKEGGSPTLEAQVLGPICAEDEMGFNAVRVVERLRQDTQYVELARKAYDRELDLFVITRALASFERTLISGNSPYDQYVNQGDTTAFTIAQKRGMRLFFSEKLGCTSCHGGFDFTHYGFENIGLYKKYKDKGRFRVSQDEADIGKFKVPTLRNVALTAPYMHDGSMPTLEAVLDHYQKGGNQHPNQSSLIKPFSLNDHEKEDIISFLNGLTDSLFIQDPRFQL